MLQKKKKKLKYFKRQLQKYNHKKKKVEIMANFLFHNFHLDAPSHHLPLYSPNFNSQVTKDRVKLQQQQYT
jgi:hypothetical protein